MKNIKKHCAALAALLMAASVLAGCSGGDASEAENTSVSVNVIGGEENQVGGSESADGSQADEAQTQGEVVTDDNGETVTGIGGEAVTKPAVSETAIDPAQTLSDEEILAAMTGTAAPAGEVNISKNNGARYAYSTLTAEEKELYDAIVSGIENLRYKICDEDAYTLEEWSKVYGMVYNQEPQLFYMGAKMKVGKLFYLTKDTAVINEMQQSIDAVADKLIAEANGKSTTFEKLKVFHDYLVFNSTFELKEEGSYDYNASIYNAFGSGEAQGNIQCAGYAKAIQYLCDKSGIDCMVVTGETSTGQTHAWNVVDVDGVWYNLDATWDDPILTTANYKNIRYNYFLVPDRYIHDITHMHVSQKKTSSGGYLTYFTPPACTETAQNYFVKNGLVYNDYESADAAIKAEIERAAKDGSRTAQITVGSKEVYDKIYNDRKSYNTYAKDFDGVKGVSDQCSEAMLLIEFDVIYS